MIHDAGSISLKWPWTAAGTTTISAANAKRHLAKCFMVCSPLTRDTPPRVHGPAIIRPGGALYMDRHRKGLDGCSLRLRDVQLIDHTLNSIEVLRELHDVAEIPSVCEPQRVSK